MKPFFKNWSYLIPSTVRTLFKVNLSIGASSFIQMIAGIVKNKILAVYTGVSGVGIYSQLFTFQGVLSIFNQQGLPQSLLKYVPEFRNDRKEELTRYIDTAYIGSIIIFILMSLVLQMFPSLISLHLVGNEFAKNFVRIIIMCSGFTAITAISEAVLQSFKDYKRLSIARSLASIGSIIIFFAFVFFYKLEGAFFGLLTYLIFSAAVTLYFVNRILKTENFKLSFRYDFSIHKILIKIGYIVLSSLFISNVSILLVRILINKEIGISANGLFQSVWGFTSIITGTIVGSLSSYILPKVVENKENEVRTKIINDSITYIIIVMIPATFFIILFKYEIIELLYSKEFYNAADFIWLKMIADVFYLIVWVIGTPLLAMNRIKAFFWLNISINIIFLFFSIFLISYIGIKGIFISYCIATIIVFIIFLCDSKQSFNFKFQFVNAILLIIFLTITILSQFI